MHGQALQTIPNIPSPLELGYMGAMKSPDGASSSTNFGRYGDTKIAHVADGEHIVPREVIDQYPELGKIIGQAISSVGADPNRYIVGSSASSINPHTGQPEFFFKKLFKKLARFALPVLGAIVLPGVGAALGASISAAGGAAIGSALGTKLSGGSWGQAIGAGIGSYVGGQFASGAGQLGPAGTVGAKLASNGLGSAASALPGAISTANLSQVTGSLLGSNIGESVGGLATAPALEQQQWGSEFANIPTASTGTSLTTGASGNTALPTGEASEPLRGAGAGTSTVGGDGVRYLDTVTDRNTGQERQVESSFHVPCKRHPPRKPERAE